MALSKDQQKVADLFMNFVIDKSQNEMVIEGYPGCGKSYLTKYLIDMLRAKSTLTQLISPGQAEMSIYCTATTNKAAAVLADLSGESTKTIHSLLGLKVTNNFDTGGTSLKTTGGTKVIENSIIIIDEASYANKQLLKFIRNLTLNCKVLYIGDRYQLATVGEQECPVFTEIANKGVLHGSQRFSDSGPIASLAAKYRATIDGADFPDIPIDGKVIKYCTGSEFRDAINAEYAKPNIDSDHAKVIAWSNKTVHAYNAHIRGLATSDLAFKVGEKVVTNQPIAYRFEGKPVNLPTESIREVTNISPGREFGIPGWWIVLGNLIKVFQPESPEQVRTWLKALANQAKQTHKWRTYFEAKDFFGDLRPIHSSTVYKAQGSTYKKVFIDLTDIGKCTQGPTVARMLHVALTRAKDEIYLYGKLPERYGGIIT